MPKGVEVRILSRAQLVFSRDLAYLYRQRNKKGEGRIMIVILIVSVLGALARYLYREKVQQDHWLDAMEEHGVMFNLYCKLCDDPFMSSEKWRTWLPLFEFSDQCLAATLPGVGLGSETFFSLKEAVKKQIDDGPFSNSGCFVK